MKEISIRQKLTLWYSVVLLTGLILFGYAAWFVFQQRLITELDQRLAQQADGLQAVIESEHIATNISQLHEEVSESAHQMPFGSVIQLRTQAGKVIALSSDSWPMAPLASTKVAFSTVERNGRRYRTLTKQIYCSGQPLTLLIADPTEQVEGVMRTFRLILLTMIPGVLLIAGFGG